MRSPIGPTGRIAAAAVVAVTMIACTSEGDQTDDPEGRIPGVPSGTVAIPQERLTPFCQSMIELSDRLETDPPDDIAALITETYTDLARSGVVPAAIAPEFGAVLAELRGEPVPTVVVEASTTTTTTATTDAAITPDGSPGPEGDEFFEEGYRPGDDPAERVNAYVAFACRDSQNNPGPPATQPLDDIAPTTDPP